MAAWTDPLVEQAFREIAALGMTMDPAGRGVIAQALNDQAHDIAIRMRISDKAARRYVDDDAVRDLAATLVAQFAAERPGSDIANTRPDIELTRTQAGLAVMALAEALRIHLANTTEPASAVLTARQCADLFSLHGGYLHAAADRDTVPVTTAWLHRIARLIDSAADVVDTGGSLADDSDVATVDLAGRFRRDAATFREAAGPGLRPV